MQTMKSFLPILCLLTLPLLSGCQNTIAVSQVSEFEGRTNWVYSIDFSPDGKKIVTTSGILVGSRRINTDNFAIIWDAESGKELKRLVGHADGVNSATFSPDGTKIVTASGLEWEGTDRTARIWDVESGEEVIELKHSRPVNYAVFAPDGKTVVSGSGFDNGNDSSPNVLIWDANSGERLRAWKGLNYKVNFIAFSPDGKKIVVAGYDTASVWDIESKKELKLLGHASTVCSAAFSPDGRKIITASLDGTARIWDTETGKELKKFEEPELPNRSARGGTDRAEVNSAVFSPDGTKIVTGSGNMRMHRGDDTTRIRDANSGRELLRMRGYKAVFSPVGKMIATTHGTTIKIWSVEL